MIVVHNPVGSPQNADHADCRLQTVQTMQTVQTVQTDYFFLTLDSLFLVLLLPNSVQNVSMLLNTKRKIRPQCVLGVLCLVLFLSVGMLYSNISIWELNCYKCEGRQVFTIFEGKMYGRILFTLSSSLIKAYY